MRVCLMIEGQEGVGWEQTLAIARACEQHGFEGLMRSDHYASILGLTDRGALHAWTTLAGLAAHTARLRLGTMVSPVTFRAPAELASSVTTVDHISGGRAELGLGAGWWEPDHRSYGFPFPPHGVRSEMLAEQVEIVHRLWTQASTTFEGQHYRLEDCRGLPKPVQNPHPPIVIGGVAKPNTVEPAVRFAQEYNSPAAPVGELARRRRLLAEACERVGREPESICFSAAFPYVTGTSERDVRAREQRLADGIERSDELAWFLEGRAETWAVGTPERLVERLEELESVGVDRVYLQHHDHTDLEPIALVGREVIPAVDRSPR